jgi:hypothetical protein
MTVSQIVDYLSFQITTKLASQPNGPFSGGSNITVENNQKKMKPLI